MSIHYGREGGGDRRGGGELAGLVAGWMSSRPQLRVCCEAPGVQGGGALRWELAVGFNEFAKHPTSVISCEAKGKIIIFPQCVLSQGS